MNLTLKKLVSQMPNVPGVYQMYNESAQLIYVGKAKRLRNRVKSYFSRKNQNGKTTALMNQVSEIKIIVTTTENEALLLESNLIKQYHPRYNVLFRDDKSYPYLFLAIGQDFPRLDFHRGAKKELGRYFGPYPSASSVRENLALVQKLFKLRQCSESFFQHRTRPCLQYQIKRCTAPCVSFVNKEGYDKQVGHALLFLEGKSEVIIDDLVSKMQQASEKLDYEQAAMYRDQIATLRKLLAQQYIVGDTGNIDILGITIDKGHAAICVLFIRGGRLLGHRSFFPQIPSETNMSQVLSAFIPQYYLHPIHEEQPLERIITSCQVEDKVWLEEALVEIFKRKIKITDHARSEQFQRWQQMAYTNAKQALTTHLATKFTLAHQFELLQSTLKLSAPILRIECFDISHTFGEHTVASCVVFDPSGPVKTSYRRYNIREITAGDDYAALEQALNRHYIGLKSKDKPLPDLLVIDGGKGQRSRVSKVLEELQVTGVTLLAISKGPNRKPGLEQLWLSNNIPLKLTPDHAVLHLLQIVRDEAHRFAITGHRQQRAKARIHSKIEEIPGIGAKRRRDLLNYFGGWQELSQASATDIAKVPGISAKLATKIYQFCHQTEGV